MKAIFTKERLPIIATSLVCIAIYVAAGLKFEGFFSLRVFLNFLTDNAFLGITAVGVTFVILSGGIDLSVGSMVGCTGIMTAVLIQNKHLHPALAIATVLLFGLLLGCGHGLLIQKFNLPPFLGTLAGVFLARGLGLWISKESVQIDHPFFSALAGIKISLPNGASLPISAILFLVVLVAGIVLAKQTRFGRTVYAIGGNESSAMLMGLSVGKTKIWIYALSGFCSALAGVVYTIYTSSGNALSGTGLELDAIAAVVIGGTLLSGGYGSVFGSFLGVLILAMIQTAINFDGSLSSWWTRIAIGTLLLIFMLLQKGIEVSARRTSKKAGH
ncbi:sugar ABC transporter permease YjfF [bacterium SCN 57-13]|nr:MAG: sugar ABC transporter permease YjfF [bacterium SCN 57-13]